MKVYQVEMSKPSSVDGVKLSTVAWIPEEHAIAGRLLDLKDREGNWEGPWTVTNVYTRSSLDSAYVREHQRIDLPSIGR